MRATLARPPVFIPDGFYLMPVVTLNPYSDMAKAEDRIAQTRTGPRGFILMREQVTT